ncbi:hypothetical protein LA080_002756 [Diaporthe eres]|uniref:J domain-containing protein n=1 Tax=Diaporthe vaccinii TaxID=105482 RepID=A0ABR4EZD0_9PEZI|nr:hypothetical protein LA080_002756 [Diaporthe eres]
MTERGSGSRRARARNSSRSATSSARSSAAFERDHDQHLQALNQPYPNRYNPSLRSVGSRVSLSDQFATTRREYEFGFDDGASFITTDAEAETDQDDTLTGAGSFDGVIVTPPASYRGAGSAPRQPGPERVRRSHYELLSLPEGDETTERDICRAYFRLCDILRSDSVPAQHQDLAERYLGHVQAAFETLSGKHSREDYDALLQDDELGESSILLSGEEGEDDVNGDMHGDMRQAGRTNPRLVQELRRQQERESTEVRLHLDAQSIATPSHRQLARQRGSPTTLSLTQTSVTSLPAISQVLQPRLRQIRTALSGATPPALVNYNKSELYCTTPTVTVTSSIFATDVRDIYLPPTSASGRQQSPSTDTFPKERQLQWYSLYFAPALNFKLRQELFIRESGLSEAALRRTLPDAVLEIETDAVNAASLTARASHVLRLDGDEGDGDQPAEPLHTEASVSVSRAWPAASYRPRFGLGLHRRVGGQKGGTVFACADSGTPSLWDSLSPSSFLNQSVRKRLDGDSTGASWRSYMDQLSQLPSYFSPPTLEVGYKFGAFSEDTLGLRSGRAFTKPAGSGLRRLHDSVGLSGPGKGGSWAISGALTTGGVAGYLRFGRNLLSSPTELEHSLIPSRLRGLRFEAELSAYKSRPDSLLGKVHSLGRSEISQLAVRGLKKFGKSSKVGLEVSVNNNSSSVVLSLYYSTRNSRSLTIPFVLFRDQPSPHQFLTNVLLFAGFLPSLALAALDHSRALLSQADAATQEEKGRRSQDLQKYIAARRAEADDLVTVLAEPVSQRQRTQRERGGLVILSAKYGVLLDERPSAPGQPSRPPPAGGPSAAAAAAASINLGPSWASPEEVADVTVALAALVDDDGTLRVPEGLRKSRLLGFWDPKPRRTKCLFVRYMFRGQERVKEVMGRDELALP